MATTVPARPARPAPAPAHQALPSPDTHGPQRAAAPAVASRASAQAPIARPDAPRASSSHAGHVINRTPRHVSTPPTRHVSPAMRGPGVGAQPTAVPPTPPVTVGTAATGRPAQNSAAIPTQPVEPPPDAPRVVRVVKNDGSPHRGSIARRAVPHR